jgi:hypothetical protein
LNGANRQNQSGGDVKKAAVIVAGVITVFSTYQAFPPQTTAIIDSADRGSSPGWWAMIQAVTAGACAVTLAADLILLAALCAFLLLLFSFITFFGVGLLILGPAAVLLVLIGLHYGHKPRRPLRDRI